MKLNSFIKLVGYRFEKNYKNIITKIKNSHCFLIIKKFKRKISFLKSYNFLKKRLLNNPGKSFVYFQNIQNIRIISKLKNKIDYLLLPNGLIIKKGFYFFDENIYSCNKYGIYRFIKPQYRQEQRLILSKSSALFNALLISLISIRGNKDDELEFKELLNLAKKRYLNLTCGYLSLFINKILKNYGFKSRKVFFYKIKIDNSYNCGHTMLEVWEKSKNKFIVVDVDKKITFYRKNKPLSLIELSDCIKKNMNYRIKKASSLSLIDLGDFKEKATNFNYAFIENFLNHNEKAVLSNFNIIFQIPVIQENNKYFACYSNKKEYIFCQKYLKDHKLLPKKKFIEIMYTN